MEVYAITSVIYESYDNSLFSETKIVTDRESALCIYNEVKENVKTDALGDTEIPFNIDQEERYLTDNSKIYLVSRKIGTIDEYQARIELMKTTI